MSFGNSYTARVIWFLYRLSGHVRLGYCGIMRTIQTHLCHRGYASIRKLADVQNILSGLHGTCLRLWRAFTPLYLVILRQTHFFVHDITGSQNGYL